MNCPDDTPENVFVQDWPGLTVMCNCKPNSGEETVIGEPCFVEDTCTTYEAINAIKSSKFKGYRVCGKRDGQPFLYAKRPEIMTNLDGSEYLQCPGTTVACDNNPYTPDKTVLDILYDKNAKENFLICANVEGFCPVTDISLRYDETEKELVMELQ